MFRKEYVEGKQRYRITVKPALNYIKGNSAPYFSITADIDREERGHWRDDAGGCLHDEIEHHFPGQFSDLIALHLSDIDGQPMHALDNGWYWLAGALDGLGERYHGGNQNDYGPGPLNPLQVFMDHCRIDKDEAARIIAAVILELGPVNEANNAPEHSREDYIRARNKWHDLCQAMRPRWEQEAKAAIARHNLIVTGDAWEHAA